MPWLLGGSGDQAVVWCIDLDALEMANVPAVMGPEFVAITAAEIAALSSQDRRYCDAFAFRA
jgi:hypothetical protein